MSIVFLKASSQESDLNLTELFIQLSQLCATSEKPIVLMIDEVDSASNNQVFIDFLAQLRDYYLDRKQTAVFQSVILAGVYDIKNLKQKIRPEEVHKSVEYCRRISSGHEFFAGGYFHYAGGV